MRGVGMERMLAAIEQMFDESAGAGKKKRSHFGNATLRLAAKLAFIPRGQAKISYGRHAEYAFGGASP
jgi:hypothetical protein